MDGHTHCHPTRVQKTLCIARKITREADACELGVACRPAYPPACRLQHGGPCLNCAVSPLVLPSWVRSGWPAPACRLLHHTHHKYNKEHTLSPFAGLAFNALDGILQVRAGRAAWCVPYVCADMLPGRPALPRRPARVAAQPHERMRLHAALPAVLAIAAGG